MATLIATLLLFLASAVSSLPPSASFPGGFRLDLTHVDSLANFTKQERIHHSLRRSTQRIKTLISTRMPITPGSGEFIVNLAIGTPPVPFPAIMDTGSDLIWTQCEPCDNCYAQSTPIFNPSSSRTFSELPCTSSLCRDLPFSYCRSTCEYVYTYGDLSSTEGILAMETFSLGKGVHVSSVGFGCGYSNLGDGFQQAAGLLGLGRGSLSLVSQLGIGRFSYCLTRFDERRTSPLFLGSMAKLDKRVESKSTPFLRNPNQPTFYYLSLRDISVGDVALEIPGSTFAINKDGTGGLIVDCGTSITFLEMEGYRMMRDELMSQVDLPVGDGSSVGLDLCFQMTSAAVRLPTVVFHFEGADLELAPENYMVEDSASGLLCLAVMGSSGLSILGNFQQQGIHLLYDLEGDRLSFQRAQCGEL